MTMAKQQQQAVADIHADLRHPAARQQAPRPSVSSSRTDKGLLFRTIESAFVEAKGKLLDECDLWCIVSLPGGFFSAAGAGVKTNLQFFTKGRKTEHIWHYDLSHVKVGKKTPMTQAHFGWGPRLEILENAALPATLVGKWRFDLKAVNPRVRLERDTRSPQEIAAAVPDREMGITRCRGQSRSRLEGGHSPQPVRA
jgi:hypothetical protein